MYKQAFKTQVKFSDYFLTGKSCLWSSFLQKFKMLLKEFISEKKLSYSILEHYAVKFQQYDCTSEIENNYGVFY